MQVELAQFRHILLNTQRHSNLKRLTGHGYKAYSQNDEDGIIAEIFRRVGTTNRKFVEFGVQTGMQCNTLWLLLQGWSGLWLQGSKNDCDTIVSTHRHWIDDCKLKLSNSFVTRENINELLLENGVFGPIDLLSIDVDRNDYWIWGAISAVAPRVVVIEYNATWAPPIELVVPYVAYEGWDGNSNYFGASLSAMAAMGVRKGYSLVGCCLAGVNAFFVHNSLLGDNFLSPGDVAEHYEPARYYFAQLESGHRPGVGPLIRPSR